MDFSRVAKHFHALDDPASERGLRGMTSASQTGIWVGITMPDWKDQFIEADAVLMVRGLRPRTEPGKAPALE